MDAILLGALIVLLLVLSIKVFYELWFRSKLVSLNEESKKETVKDYIIFEYTLGEYMGMISISIPVLTKDYDIYTANCKIESDDGDIEKVKQRKFHIGYEVEKNSEKFFVYSTMKAKDGELRFATYLGENPCRFIIFTDESNLAFIPDNKNIKILESTESVDYVFAAMPWQKWGNKKFSKIRIDNNKLIPYEKVEKEVYYNDSINNADYEGANMPSPLP